MPVRSRRSSSFCPGPAACRLRGLIPRLRSSGCLLSCRYLFLLLLHFLHIQPGKKDLRPVGDSVPLRIESECTQSIEIPQGCIHLVGNLLRRFRHKGLQKGSADDYAFHQVIEHRGQPVRLVRILCQQPGLCLVDIFIAAPEQAEDLRQCVRCPKLLHFLRRLCVYADGRHPQVAVRRGILLRQRRALVRHHAAEIFVAHGHRAVHQVPQGVGQVGIRSFRNQLPGGVAVIFIGHLMHHVIPHRVHAEKVHQIVHVDHIPLGLAHLPPVHHQPGMSEYLLRQRLPQSHQEDRPVDGVETDDVLPDQVKVRGPELLVLLRAVPLRVIADSCDIVGQRVQPHINYVFVVKIHGNPPFEGCPGHAQILQTRQQEIVHHLVLPGHRLDKLRMLVDMPDQPVRVFAHTEKISLLLRGLYLPAAVRTFPVHQL